MGLSNLRRDDETIEPSIMVAGLTPQNRSIDTVVLLPDDKVFFVIWRAVIMPCVPEDNDVEEVRIEYEGMPRPEVVQ